MRLLHSLLKADGFGLYGRQQSDALAFLVQGALPRACVAVASSEVSLGVWQEPMPLLRLPLVRLDVLDLRRRTGVRRESHAT